jgi:chromosome segregation ATPase
LQEKIGVLLPERNDLLDKNSELNAAKTNLTKDLANMTS